MVAHRRFLFLSISLLILNTFVTCHEQDEPVEFGYIGDMAPDKWGSLSPRFSLCSNGKAQSPIDIVKDKATHSNKLISLDRDYKPAKATLVNDGLSVGIKFEGNAGVLGVDGKNYSFVSMHWHSPSEHRIDGETFDVELHLIHKASDKSVAVISILYQIGNNADSLLARIHNKLSDLAKEKCKKSEISQIEVGTLDVKQLRKSTRKYFRYTGSYTTPPCTENLTWFILGKVRSISKQQVDALKAPLDVAFQNNSRPVQPLNDRVVELYDENKK